MVYLSPGIDVRTELVICLNDRYAAWLRAISIRKVLQIGASSVPS